MNKKETSLIVAILVTIFLVAVFLNNNKEQIVGGERDEHGCLGSAGYQWSEDVDACIRVWELDETQKKAARIAVDYLKQEYGITIIQVLVARCPGCFMVEVEKGKDRIKVTLENWKIIKKSLTPGECVAKKGRVLNVVGGATCFENETSIGDVTGFISPAICCLFIEEIKICTKEQRNVDACIEIYQPVCGWNDPKKIQCIKFPCASTYSNSCFACQDENVLYYTEGECPE